MLKLYVSFDMEVNPSHLSFWPDVATESSHWTHWNLATVWMLLPQTCPLQHALYPPSVCLSVQWLMDLAPNSLLPPPKALASGQITWDTENSLSHGPQPTHSHCFRSWGTCTHHTSYPARVRGHAVVLISYIGVNLDTQTQSHAHFSLFRLTPIKENASFPQLHGL